MQAPGMQGQPPPGAAAPRAKKRPSVVLIVLFIVLGLLVLAGIAFGVIWFMGGLHLSAVPITVVPRA